MICKKVRSAFYNPAVSVPSVAIVASVLLLGCVSKQNTPVVVTPESDVVHQSAVAPVELPQEAQEEVVVLNDDLTASELLEVALGFLKSGNDEVAADAFTRAISTGYLSDAGRALAYWYIHLAQKSQGSQDASIDALASFVVLAQDLIAHSNGYQFAGGQPDDFITQFDLTRRLSLARAVMSSNWSRRSATFGRSAQHPVLVHDDIELAYFVELSSACVHGGQEMVRETLLVDGELIHQVTIHCVPQTAAQNFFFEMHTTEAPRFPLARR